MFELDSYCLCMISNAESVLSLFSLDSSVNSLPACLGSASWFKNLSVEYSFLVHFVISFVLLASFISSSSFISGSSIFQSSFTDALRYMLLALYESNLISFDTANYDFLSISLFVFMCSRYFNDLKFFSKMFFCRSNSGKGICLFLLFS